MKSDARLLLNKKKWKKSSNNQNNNESSWKSRNLKPHSGPTDARKILNLKRKQKFKAPVLGSYMRTKTASELIASQIRKEIIPKGKVPEKRVQLSSDGNLIITSKPKKVPEEWQKSFDSLQGSSMQCDSLSDSDDLEHSALEDLFDLDSLPPAYVSPKVAQNTNLSRQSYLGSIIDMKNTMVADQLSESTAQPVGAKIYVSNLHSSVSLSDVMELFGDVGVITDVEMLRPGTAVIHFFDENDAKKACEIYHNRLLDGQPMKCYMQVDTKHQKMGISQRLGNRIVAPPTQNAVSKSLTTNPMSRYNPRNVQFTVKLT